MATEPGDRSIGCVRRASCLSTLGRGRPAPGLEAGHDLTYVEVRGREDGVRGAVVEPDAAIPEIEMAAREDGVVEEAVALVGLLGGQDRLRRACEHSGRVVPLAQQRAHGVG